METRFTLSDQLINFAVAIIKLAEKLPKSFTANHLAGQLTRSGTAPALHYGEAQSAESRSDFIHKMKIAVKELRETNNCLKIIDRMNWISNNGVSAELIECNELISIFIKSIHTAQKNRDVQKN